MSLNAPLAFTATSLRVLITCTMHPSLQPRKHRQFTGLTKGLAEPQKTSMNRISELDALCSPRAFVVLFTKYASFIAAKESSKWLCSCTTLSARMLKWVYLCLSPFATTTGKNPSIVMLRENESKQSALKCAHNRCHLLARLLSLMGLSWVSCIAVILIIALDGFHM